ncbi:MAG: hypothetical protein JWQ81_8728 [Amycolatopsis sp.]|nr:hypothetical protein [Amycolatopsis sp.]
MTAAPGNPGSEKGRGERGPGSSIRAVDDAHTLAKAARIVRAAMTRQRLRGTTADTMTGSEQQRPQHPAKDA